ncbi:MAG: alpha/beta hydrolase [Thermoplasmatota archaeon]
METTLQVNGTRLVGDLVKAKRARGGVLLVHGFNSCAQEYGELPDALAKAGFTAFAIDLRGHGRSGGERGRVDLQRACQDIDVALDELRRHVKKKPLALIGHSLGGAMVIGHTSRTPRVDKLVVAHPVDRLFDELGLLDQLGYHVIGALAKRRARQGRPARMVPRPPKYRDLFVDPAAAAHAASDGFLGTHVNAANYTFATTMQASDWATRVRVPVLAITSRHDKAVKPAHSEHVISQFPGPVQHVTHRGGHSCWRDLDGDLLTGAIVDFLRQEI